MKNGTRAYFSFLILLIVFFSSGCIFIEIPYDIAKGTIQACIWVVKGTYELTAGTTKLVYKIGEFTYNVARAPSDRPLINDEIETMDGLPVKEAIRLGRVKTARYRVRGKTYYPMSVKDAERYSEMGTSSWYGYENSGRRGAYMTASGETFDPDELTAAHRYLPLPFHVKVTNLENDQSVIVRVNDRGPFPLDEGQGDEVAIIDVSAAAAKKLGFYEKSKATVKVEAIQLSEG